MAQAPAQTMLDWLAQNTGCVFSSAEGQAILERLRGQHVYVWQEGNAFVFARLFLALEQENNEY